MNVSVEVSPSECLSKQARGHHTSAVNSLEYLSSDGRIEKEIVSWRAENDFWWSYNLSLCLVKTRLVTRKHLIPPSSMDNICSLLFMIEVSHRPHNRQLPVGILRCRKLWIAIFNEEKAKPYMRTQYPTIKAPPHHGHIGCAVLNAALLPEEVYVMPICKLAQEEILGSRTRRCRLWRESHLTDKRNSQMIDCSLHNNTNSLLVKADRQKCFSLFLLIKRQNPLACKHSKTCR